MFSKKDKKEAETETAEGEVKPEAEKEVSDLEREKKNVESLTAQLTELQKQLDNAQTEAGQWKNKYATSLADIKNLRAEISRDNELVLKYASEPIVKKLIPFLTSMDQSFRFEPKDDPKAAGWIKGIHLAYKQLLSALTQEGVSVVEPKVGDSFDPKVMEAVDTQEGEEADKIALVWGNGVLLKDRLIQPARVVVTVAKPAPSEENKAEEGSEKAEEEKSQSEEKENKEDNK